MTDAVVERPARGDHEGGRPRLVAAVNRRLELARRIFEHKEANGIPIVDAGREDAMIDAARCATTPGRCPTRASPSSSATCSS